MGTVKKFEDLEIWNKAREICRDIYEIKERTDLKTGYKLYNQINGSTGSTMDNIAEGFERNGNKQFHQFLSIAKAPAESPDHNYIGFLTEGISNRRNSKFFITN